MSERIKGMRQLKRKLSKMEKVPTKHLTASVRKGMNIVLKESRENAPVDTGELKRGMKLKLERSKIKGKKVFRIIFDPAKNDIFQKKNDKGEVIGYYPISQEFGFFAKNGRYIPGYRFIRGSLVIKSKPFTQTVINEMTRRINSEVKK